jgi:CRISPR-associated protein Cas2
MYVLIVYDVSTVDRDGPKRLRHVARACEDFGQRVQKSVFECRLGDTEWAVLKPRLLAAIDPATDSIRAYFLDADVRVEHYGTNLPVDLNAALVI